MADPTPTAPAPAPAVPAAPVKAGWLTSEHLLTLLAIILVSLEGSGIIPSGSGWLRAVEMGVTILAALGYTGARTAVKTAAMRRSQGGFLRGDLLVLLPLVAILCGSLIVACSAAQRSAEKQFLACTETAAINDLKPTVESILENGGASWEKQLEALAVAFGKDDLGCAVIAAEQMFANKAAAPPLTPTVDHAAAAAARADQYLHDHNLAPAPES